MYVLFFLPTLSSKYDYVKKMYKLLNLVEPVPAGDTIKWHVTYSAQQAFFPINTDSLSQVENKKSE